MGSEGDAYRVLGVSAEANATEITTAYRALARRYHPDISAEPDAEHQMARINAAWSILRDPEKRAALDRRRATSRGTKTGANPADGRAGTNEATDGRSTAGADGPWRPTARESGHEGEGAAGPPPGNPRGSVVPFGRHIGWSIGEIARVDPGYLAWLAERREGARYRDEIQAVLAAMRPPDSDPPGRPGGDTRRR